MHRLAHQAPVLAPRHLGVGARRFKLQAVARNPASERWLTRREVQQLTGRSYDSVRRDEKAGLYPRARQRSGGAVEIPLGDLLLAGHIAPGSMSGELSPGSPSLSDLVELRARCELLELQLSREQDEVRFLRRALQGALSAGAA